jgi:hypothetical protein
MDNLRKTLNNPNIGLVGSDIIALTREWTELKRHEIKGWYMLHINTALREGIIDPDLFLSVAIYSTTSWQQFPLVGAALKYGANPNGYFTAPGIGPVHILIYTQYQANKNNLPPTEKSALCAMLIAMGSLPNSPAYSETGGIVTPSVDVNFDRPLVDLLTRTFSQPTYRAPQVKVALVADWFASQGILLPINYDSVKDRIRSWGSGPAITIGASISRYELAFMFPEALPGFGFLIECQADGQHTSDPGKQYAGVVLCDNLFASYPILPGYARVINGEFLGMTQAIQSGCLAAFEVYINSGIECSYFIINRICYHLAKACVSQDRAYRDALFSSQPLATNQGFDTTVNDSRGVLIPSILYTAIRSGATIDVWQFNMIKNSDPACRNLALVIEDVYREPKWRKYCSVNNESIPDSLRHLAFNLGINYKRNKAELCAELIKLSMTDTAQVRQNAIDRKRALMGTLTSTPTEYIRVANPSLACSNGQFDPIIPEEYNDTLMSFYRDGDKIFCYTSNEYKDMSITERAPGGTTPLPPEYLETIKQHSKILKALGIDPSLPISITQAAEKLNVPDAINIDESTYVANTIIKILEIRSLPPADPSVFNSDKLNAILVPLFEKPEDRRSNADWDLLCELQPSHQIVTFYHAVHFALRHEPSKTSIFIQQYKIQLTSAAPLRNMERKELYPGYLSTCYSSGVERELKRIEEGPPPPPMLIQGETLGDVFEGTTTEPILRTSVVEPIIRVPTLEPIVRTPVIEPIVRVPTVEPLVRAPTLAPVPTLEPVVVRTPVVEQIIRTPVIETGPPRVYTRPVDITEYNQVMGRRYVTAPEVETGYLDANGQVELRKVVNRPYASVANYTLPS